MPFEVANRAFEEAFGLVRDTGKGECKSNKELMDEFMAMLRNYLHGRNEWSAQAMRRWLRGGGNLSAFNCREDAVQPVIDGFLRYQIPFVHVRETTGGTGFLIRECDAGRTREMTSDVLGSLSVYCKVTTSEQAGLFYRRGKFRDKKMLHLTGLSKEEVYYLEEEAREALPGKAVGIDRMSDGTYMLTCHGASAFDDAMDHPFREALMESRLLANGESACSIAERGSQREEYLKQKTAGFPDLDGGMDSPVWIVGNGDSYVKRSQDGFELGHAVDVDGEVFLSTDLTVPLSDSAYERRLNSALSHITGHRCLYSMQDVLEHFRGKKDRIVDPREVGQKALIRNASRMVAAKDAAEAGKKKKKTSWKQKMEQYQESMGVLLTAAAEGKIPAGYTKTDILQLRRVIRTFDLNMSLAAPAIDRMRNGKVYEREAGPARVADVEALIASLSGQDMGLGFGLDSRERRQEDLGL